MERTKKIVKFSDWPKFNLNDAITTKKVLLSGKVNYWTGTKSREFEHLFKKKFVREGHYNF